MDPHSSSLLDLKPGGKIFQINTEKMQRNWYRYRNNCKFIQFFKVYLHKLHYILLLRNLLCFLQLNKTPHKDIFHKFLSWIRIRICYAAGSGSAFRKTAGSGSAKNECGSTALPLFLMIFINDCMWFNKLILYRQVKNSHHRIIWFKKYIIT